MLVKIAAKMLVIAWTLMKRSAAGGLTQSTFKLEGLLPSSARKPYDRT